MTSPGAKIVQPLPLSKRKHLANYLGRDQGKVGRLKLIELAKQFPEKVRYFLQLVSFSEWSLTNMVIWELLSRHLILRNIYITNVYDIPNSWNLQFWSSVVLTNWESWSILSTCAMLSSVLLLVENHLGHFDFTSHFSWYVSTHSLSWLEELVIQIISCSISTGVCTSCTIGPSWIAFPECNWLLPDLNKMAIKRNWPSTVGVPRVNSRLIHSPITSCSTWYCLKTYARPRTSTLSFFPCRWDHRQDDSTR